jgi:hypothetical protein
MLSMKMIPSRELSARPGAVWADLEAEGVVVITRDGQPMGIITPTSASTLLEDMQNIAFAKARRAAQELRSAAVANGTANMSAGEIEAEILLARKERWIGRRRK